ncbi:putative dolicholphosphate-mannose synthase [Trypanosoma grayi]|uniref:putative dolicholphosphate-mannose synthase n=1 Tax=Trypanosoma grayi TaxID=71804 RepID=UPI0004F462CC|nr:putative dolicholphosphate-mannose synthase [Trypanosoma grayi]KEG12207.1 putative dolicholphosphate-mannose synthase [Trypanosoma grayi]
MGTEVNHWSFFQLPPFFTLQPGPAALMRQVSLWGNLIMDHAAYHAPHTRRGSCRFLRLYKTTSDVFRNPSISRRLPADAARRMLEALVTQQPNFCAAVRSDDDDKEFAVLVACNAGGLKEIEESLLSWLLDSGAGTTTEHLARSGVVMTFDELAEGNCLAYNRARDPLMGRLTQDPVPIPDVGTLSEEQAVRAFLQALMTRPVSVLRPFRITFFNLDGSERQPYQGVKFGGALPP